MREFVVITGLSGAGRSGAGDILEDLGWYVIDNLPPTLMAQVAELGDAPGAAVQRVALVVGPGPYQEDVLPALEDLHSRAARMRVLFLEASTGVLVRRFELTRRRHPLVAGGSLAEAIESERALLEPVKAHADVVVDTSELNLHQLRDRIRDLFADDADETMQITVTSFGFKHGLPLDADMVIDCRFLPNPHWDEALRPLSGQDADIVAFLDAQDLTGPFLERIDDLLAMQLPAFEAEGKSYLSIAFGCTGGRHRSVAMAEAVANSLMGRGYRPRVVHRDLER
jgi:RNase adapter protein RapZ